MSRSGLIPARAGNTRRQLPRTRSTRAHPRSRGEHPILVLMSSRRAGSSPLARGTLQRRVMQLDQFGLIPARAGNTWCLWFPIRPLRAHPRSRGEHVPCQVWVERWSGSSPLARGTLIQVEPQGALAGLIPARAGNTRGGLKGPAHPWAHPRSRGEHISEDMKGDTKSGSSPLARGTPTACLLAAFSLGLIPARAGNTPVVRAISRISWAHPRSRGEHGEAASVPCPVQGSSPLARGTR